MPSGTITSITLQTGDRERVNIFVDGVFAIGITLSTLQREGLRIGHVLSDEGWQRLQQAESDNKAWEAALRLLEVRPRAERELRDRLIRKQFTPEQIDSVIERLRRLELLDDAHFARLWVQNRAATRPKGSQMLRRELLSKGVDRQIVDETVTAALDPEAEMRACEQVARQAFRRYAKLTDRQEFQRKLGGMLQRRGFSWETVRPVLQQLWSERDDELASDEDV